MTLLVDTSVLVKWFHERGEAQVSESRELLRQHLAGAQRLLVLDLGLYELGNILLRPLAQPADVVTDALDVVRRAVGPVVHPRPSWYTAGVRVALAHGLTYYDALWAASADALGVPLVTADQRLLQLPFAVTPVDVLATG